MTESSKISASARQTKIRELLSEQQAVSIPQLAERFGVSEMTIRRDLDRLEAAGQVRRTHGGAQIAQRMTFEFNFTARRQANRRAKQAIAAAARERIHPGDRVILDSGTTTLELAHLLKDFDDLTVITPSLAVASELQFSDGIQTVLLGGVVRRGSPDLTGMIAEKVLDMFAVDIAFQGGDGIALDGAMYTDDMRVSKVDEKIRKRASKTYVLADSSKIGKTALARHGFLQETEGLITDDGIDPEHKKILQETGATITVVKTKD